MSVGFVISFIVYGIYPEGSFWVGYLFAGVYLIALLGFGLLTSTFADTQQQGQCLLLTFLCWSLFCSAGYFRQQKTCPISTLLNIYKSCQLFNRSNAYACSKRKQFLGLTLSLSYCDGFCNCV